MSRILICGGAGHIGSVLVKLLLERGYEVTVLDTFWFWDDYKEFVRTILPCGVYSDQLVTVKGDMRDKDVVMKSLGGVDKVILLACLSNDPSAEIDKVFTEKINFVGPKNVIDCSKEIGVKLLVYASSSSVYGIQEGLVSEEVKPEPLTQYSELKVKVENYLLSQLDDNFKGVIIRPATVCGMSPRMRLDLVANILTYNAVKKGVIKVFGGSQLRPLIHIKDVCRLYEYLLRVPIEKVDKKVFNVGSGNYSIDELAGMVKKLVDVPIEKTETKDMRSYHIDCKRMREELGFEPTYSVRQAIVEMKEFFESSKEDFESDRFYNIRTIKKIIEGGG